MGLILMLLCVLSTSAQSIQEIEDVIPRNGIPPLRNIEIAWEKDGRPIDISALIGGRLPVGISIGIDIIGTVVSDAKAQMCGTYTGAILRPVESQTRLKIALELDVTEQAWRCEVIKVKFEWIRDARDLIQAAESKRQGEAEEVARILKLRQFCQSVYTTTSNKRLSDVTVKESDWIQSCKAVGMYPPSASPRPTRK